MSVCVCISVCLCTSACFVYQCVFVDRRRWDKALLRLSSKNQVSRFADSTCAKRAITGFLQFLFSSFYWAHVCAHDFLRRFENGTAGIFIFRPLIQLASSVELANELRTEERPRKTKSLLLHFTAVRPS